MTYDVNNIGDCLSWFFSPPYLSRCSCLYIRDTRQNVLRRCFRDSGSGSGSRHRWLLLWLLFTI